MELPDQKTMYDISLPHPRKPPFAKTYRTQPTPTRSTRNADQAQAIPELDGISSTRQCCFDIQWLVKRHADSSPASPRHRACNKHSLLKSSRRECTCVWWGCGGASQYLVHVLRCLITIPACCEFEQQCSAVSLPSNVAVKTKVAGAPSSVT